MPEITDNKNVDRLTYRDKTIFLVGTAHVSHSSVELVDQVIREVEPDSVAVELCSSRAQALRDPERWKNTDIISVIKEGKTFLLLAQLILAGFQRKIGKDLNIKPGAEMLRAMESADSVNAAVVMADREIKTTLQRTWSSLGIWGLTKLLASSIMGMSKGEVVTAEEVERLKSSDALNELMKEFSEAMPEVRRSLIDERDQYLAAKIRTAPGSTIVAVVGAGHVSGIKAVLEQEIDLAVLDTVPPRSPLVKIVSWSIPALAVALLIYGFFAGGKEMSFEMIKAWYLVNGFAAAVGAALALAHPLSVLSAFFAAPFTALNPFMASGWVSGLVEALLRKPRVLDLENVLDDIGSFKGIFKNRLTHILLVVALTNLTGTVGAILGIQQVAALVYSL